VEKGGTWHNRKHGGNYGHPPIGSQTEKKRHFLLLLTALPLGIKKDSWIEYRLENPLPVATGWE